MENVTYGSLSVGHGGEGTLLDGWKKKAVSMVVSD